MKIICQCAVILGFLAIGELLGWLTGVKLPSSIIGMLLLTLCLQIKLVKLKQVEIVANFLVKNLAFFFIPPGIALMLHLGIIKAQIVPIVVASVVSTVVVFMITGWVYQFVRVWQRDRSGRGQ